MRGRDGECWGWARRAQRQADRGWERENQRNSEEEGKVETKRQKDTHRPLVCVCVCVCVCVLPTGIHSSPKPAHSLEPPCHGQQPSPHQVKTLSPLTRSLVPSFWSGLSHTTSSPLLM